MTNTDNKISKAELASQLGVSRAYVTMLCSGRRKWTDELTNKLNGLKVASHILAYDPKSCSSASSDTSPIGNHLMQ
jgi:transcriptional regulator with XRE-family HTH domain